MASTPSLSVGVKTVSGKAAGKVQLADDVFGIQPNVPVMHQVVTAQLAARRAGTQSTKTRAEVSGGGKKPFKQKGTGNARQGSTRAPHFSGGGVALGPKPRSYDQRTPKKMINLAMRSALSDRAAEGKVVVIDEWGFDAPKTKSAKAALSSLGIEGKALVVIDRDDVNTIKSFLNLREVQLIERAELNAYDILCNEYVVFTRATLPTGATLPTASKTAAPADEAAAALADLGDLPAGAAAPLADGSAPDGHDITGNNDSGLYHVPGSRFYDQTVAEIWFATAEAAEAAGFQLPPSQRDGAETGEDGAQS
jgi:large subunit ribosomal protein L4